MTLRVVSLALSYILGIALTAWTGFVAPPLVMLAFVLAGIALSAYLLATELRWKEWPRPVIALACVLCGLPLGCWRTSHHTGAPVPGTARHALAALDEGQAVTLRGHVVREPELRSAREGDLRIRVRAVRAAPGEPWVNVKPADVAVRIYALRNSAPEQQAAFNKILDPGTYGHYVELEGRYYPPSRPKNPGEFDAQRFLDQQDLAARFRCYVGRVTVLEETRGNLLGEVAFRAKRRFLVTYRHTIRAPASRLVAAATLGTRRAVEGVTFRDKEIVESFRHAGVGHVLAVSGLHVSVVCVLLYSLCRISGLRPKAFTPPLILFLVLFAILTGARPSSVRAVIMNSVILIAMAYLHCGLRRATFVGLALSSFFILLGNPLVLFAASFLLSFGAVLSLVLISPPVDRWLRRQRGYTLLFLGLWLTLLTTIVCKNVEAVLDPWNGAGLVGLFWCLLQLGAFLNNRSTRAWSIGLDRLPTALRLFFCAQLAIQAGMMIPLSAWFFGRFPVAGGIVNLLAIPAIGVLVQLGMLTGLVGLTPHVGLVLAAPFGAAATVVGHFFFELAHLATVLFPFPATPRPTPAWMLGYYAVLALLLSAGSWGPRLQAVGYRTWASSARLRNAARFIWAVPVMMMALPLANLGPRTERFERLICCSSGRYPLLTIFSRSHKSVLINSGSAFTGERLVFDVLRSHGAASVGDAVICGPQPWLGVEGLASLSPRMRVRRCHLPVVVDDPADYLEALKDPYLAKSAADGEGWRTEAQGR